MPKRIGNLWEIFVSEENCINAEIIMCNNHKNNRLAKYISQNPKKFGKSLSYKLQHGYSFHASKDRTIKDSYKGKERHLQIPCLEDIAAQQAWLNVATKYIEQKNYFYNCGSIPKAGQKRAVIGLKRKLKGPNASKWAAVTDIKEFYKSCPHEAVIDGLKEIFKDKKFINFAKLILKSMSNTKRGLAIGHPASHWFANVSLMRIDHELCRRFPDVHHVRYMDDVPFVSRNKRHLRKAVLFFRMRVRELGMRIKNSWQIFPIYSRGISFLSYRFYVGYTILTKKLMFRISRKMKKASRFLTPRMARSVMSYMGILKYCNSYSFIKNRVLIYININTCKKIISRADKLRFA